MEKIIEYSILGFLTFWFLKGKFFSSKSSEYDTMQKALEVWKEYTSELTNRVNALTDEISELRVENNQLKKEIQNLESLLKQKQYGS